MNHRPVTEIPGYYYDPEKRKYFKVQSSSTAPASSAYSSHDVKLRKARDQQTEATKTMKTRQKGRIRRSNLSKDFLAGGILERAHGRRVGIDTAEIYAAGLIPQGGLHGISRFEHNSDPLFDIEAPLGLNPSMVDITMAFDDQTFTARLNPDMYTRSTKYNSLEICHDYSVEAFGTAIERTFSRFGHSGDSTSLSIHKESRTIAMTWLAGTNGSGIAITPMVTPFLYHEPERSGIVIGHMRDADVSIWSSVASPASSSDIFAFGSSHGITIVDKLTLDVRTTAGTLLNWENAPQDVLALEYLDDSPSVLLSGSRRGILNLIDLRVPFDGKDTIHHSSSITHIKQLDAHRILVAGLRSNLCQYDLRFRKTDTTTARPPQSSGKRRKTMPPQNTQSTKPILTYLGYKNESRPQTGLDVDLDSGIIAAAMDDGRDYEVGLFSLHGGTRLECPAAVPNRGYNLRESGARVSKCVKWVEEVPGKGKSLYAGMGKRVQRIAWGQPADCRPVI